jgi:hypothetical protein
MGKTKPPFAGAGYYLLCYQVLKALEIYESNPTLMTYFKYSTPAKVDNVELEEFDDQLNVTFRSKKKKIVILLPTLGTVEKEKLFDLNYLLAQALEVLRPYFEGEREFTDLIVKLIDHCGIWTISERSEEN